MSDNRLPEPIEKLLAGDQPASFHFVEPIRDFWAIVGLTSDGHAYVLRQSSDCQVCEIFTDGLDTSDNGDDLAWAVNLAPGIYRLTLNPLGDEDSFHLNARLAETLYELPAP